MNKKEFKEIEKLMSKLYSIDADDVDSNFKKLNEKVKAHHRGEDVFESKSEFLSTLLSTHILHQRRLEIEEITERTKKEVNAARPSGRDIMIQDYSEEVISQVFENVNAGVIEINDVDDLNIEIAGLAETYGEEYGSEFINDVINAAHRNLDVIDFRLKLEAELKEDQSHTM